MKSNETLFKCYASFFKLNIKIKLPHYMYDNLVLEIIGLQRPMSALS